MTASGSRNMAVMGRPIISAAGWEKQQKNQIPTKWTHSFVCPLLCSLIRLSWRSDLSITKAQFAISTQLITWAVSLWRHLLTGPGICCFFKLDYLWLDLMVTFKRVWFCSSKIFLSELVIQVCTLWSSLFSYNSNCSSLRSSNYQLFVWLNESTIELKQQNDFPPVAELLSTRWPIEFFKANNLTSMLVYLPETRSWFMQHYADCRTSNISLLLRRCLELKTQLLNPFLMAFLFLDDKFWDEIGNKFRQIVELIQKCVPCASFIWSIIQDYNWMKIFCTTYALALGRKIT